MQVCSACIRVADVHSARGPRIPLQSHRTMADAPDQQGSTPADDGTGGGPFDYPTNHVIAVLDSSSQLSSALDALTTNGFLESEVHVSCGSDAAARLAESTGHRGLAGLAVRIAEKLGVADEEMENKDQYEQAMRAGKLVVRVAAPTDERKALASRVLHESGGSLVRFYGRFAIEDMAPPGMA